MMRITIDIDEQQLAAIQQATGITGKSPAVRRVIEDHLEGFARRRFLERVMAGETDYGLTNREIEDLGAYDPG